MTDDGDAVVTEADLAAARRRWADPAHEPVAPEVFARPVVGDGVRGDVPLPRPRPESPNAG